MTAALAETGLDVDVLSRLASLPAGHGTTVLLIEVGSTLHGTGLPGGEDLDILGVAVPTPERLLGRSGDFGTWSWRTQPDGVASGPGDVDLTVHSIRKFVGLCLDGNPSMLLGLFAPDDYCHYRTALGDDLRRHARKWCASRSAGPRFRGYLNGQRQRWAGEKARHGRVRKEGAYMVGPDGDLYDGKYAMHMVRLALQGVEFLTRGTITLPMPGADGALCRDIRRGRYTRREVEAMIDDLDRDLTAAWTASPLPERADVDAANAWLHQAHLAAWGYDA